MKLKLILPALAATTVAAQAAVTLASYDSGVAAAAGAAGAPDPTTQGWTTSPGVGANGWTTPLDSGNGGWRIMDGTSKANAYYQTSLDAAGAAGLAVDWTATWTVASNGDLVNATTYLDNWVSGTESRQNNNAVWIEQAGGFRYIMTVKSSGGVMQIDDGTSTIAITGHGFNQEADPFDGTPATTTMDFVTLTLSYEAGTGTATLFEGATNYGPVATTGSGTTDRIIFGAYNSGGLGSTTWNALSIDSTIPEPSTAALLGLGGLALIRRRRK